MTHVGEELRFVLTRLRKLPALVVDFLEQANVLDRDHSLVGEGYALVAPVIDHDGNF